MLVNKRHHNQIPLEELLQQVDTSSKNLPLIEVVDAKSSSHNRKRDSIDSRFSDIPPTTLSPDMKERANKLTFEICAELVAYEISNMFRKTINRN